MKTLLTVLTGLASGALLVGAPLYAKLDVSKQELALLQEAQIKATEQVAQLSAQVTQLTAQVSHLKSRRRT